MASVKRVLVLAAIGGTVVAVVRRLRSPGAEARPGKVGPSDGGEASAPVVLGTVPLPGPIGPGPVGDEADVARTLGD